ncbi:ervatamin-B-like [Prosopis cineraria]|uniref:ervatamin-B-like n=1 Tax=Prosopis cineraria TaxID=364024 RepID=UPI00240EA234|nr:ervatamin-B-like [Prosopis cineraria]XP_054778226.1 ervatamin-B-like [Prosopis cineraria]
MICLSFSLPSEFSILNYDDDLDKFTSEEELFELFQLWQKEHKREHKTLDEKSKRFEIFKSSVKYIKEENAKRTSVYDYRLGLNKFSDLTLDEFKETYLIEMEHTEGGNIGEPNSDHCPNAPLSLDWWDFGAVTDVKDQKNCGSCWAFSSTEAIEGMNKIDYNTLVSVSEQQLMSCDPNTHGCNGGQVYKAFEYVIKNGGIASESDYPYEAINGTCNHQKEKKVALAIEGYGKVKSLCEPCLLCAVSRQPGLFDANSCPNVERWCTDHAMLIVGYGSLGPGHDYWIVKNSWGKDWGDNGYIYIKTNTGDPFGVCNFNCYAYYPTKNILKLDSAI